MPPHSMIEWMIGQNVPGARPVRQPSSRRKVMKVELSTDEDSDTDTLAFTLPRSGNHSGSIKTKSCSGSRAVGKATASSKPRRRKKVRFKDTPSLRSAMKKKVRDSSSGAPTTDSEATTSHASDSEAYTTDTTSTTTEESKASSSEGLASSSGFESESSSDAKRSEQEYEAKVTRKRKGKKKAKAKKSPTQSAQEDSETDTLVESDTGSEPGSDADSTGDEVDQNPHPTCHCPSYHLGRRRLRKMGNTPKGTKKHKSNKSEKASKGKKTKPSPVMSEPEATETSTVSESEPEFAAETEEELEKKLEKLRAEQAEAIKKSGNGNGNGKKTGDGKNGKGKKNSNGNGNAAKAKTASSKASSVKSGAPSEARSIKSTVKSKSGSVSHPSLSGSAKSKSEARPPSAAPFPPPGIRKPNLIMPVKAEVLQVEHTIEDPNNDPRPNAFLDHEHGVCRVYHGPAYGNPYGSLYPRRIWPAAHLDLGTPHPSRNPYLFGAIPAGMPPEEIERLNQGKVASPPLAPLGPPPPGFEPEFNGPGSMGQMPVPQMGQMSPPCQGLNTGFRASRSPVNFDSQGVCGHQSLRSSMNKQNGAETNVAPNPNGEWASGSQRGRNRSNREDYTSNSIDGNGGPGTLGIDGTNSNRQPWNKGNGNGWSGGNEQKNSNTWRNGANDQNNGNTLGGADNKDNRNNRGGSSNNGNNQDDGANCGGGGSNRKVSEKESGNAWGAGSNRGNDQDRGNTWANNDQDNGNNCAIGSNRHPSNNGGSSGSGNKLSDIGKGGWGEDENWNSPKLDLPGPAESNSPNNWNSCQSNGGSRIRDNNVSPRNGGYADYWANGSGNANGGGVVWNANKGSGWDRLGRGGGNCCGNGGGDGGDWRSGSQDGGGSHRPGRSNSPPNGGDNTWGGSQQGINNSFQNGGNNWCGPQARGHSRQPSAHSHRSRHTNRGSSNNNYNYNNSANWGGPVNNSPVQVPSTPMIPGGFPIEQNPPSFGANFNTGTVSVAGFPPGGSSQFTGTVRDDNDRNGGNTVPFPAWGDPTAAQSTKPSKDKPVKGW